MPARRPDYYLIAALVLHGILPDEVGELLVSLYDDTPPPLNLRTAIDTLHTVIQALVDSGGLGNIGEDEDGEDEDGDILPMHPLAQSTPGLVRGSSLPIVPPLHVISAFEWWAEVREFEASRHHHET